MTESSGPVAGGGGRRDVLDPMTRALAGLVLAVVGLMGPNVFASGLQYLAEGAFGGGQATFLFWMAVSAALPLGLGLWLALEPARGAGGWVTSVARAAVVVALLGLAGSLLLVLGAFVHA